MADIELVIKMPEEVYRYAKKYNVSSMLALREMSICMNAIANGTQLPKGHGRLIDADDLKRIGRYAHTNTDIDNAPTIIEADRSKNDNT